MIVACLTDFVMGYMSGAVFVIAVSLVLLLVRAW